MNKTIVLDIDGVVLQWNSQIIPFIHSKGKQVPTDILRSIFTNSFIDFKALNEIIPNFLEEYHSSTFGKLLHLFDPRIPTALVHLKKENHYKFVALTCFSSDSEVSKNRVLNLESYFGNLFEEIIVLPAGSSKKNSLADLSLKYEILLFVDDSMEHYNTSVEILGEENSFHFSEKNNWNTLLGKIESLRTFPLSNYPLTAENISFKQHINNQGLLLLWSDPQVYPDEYYLSECLTTDDVKKQYPNKRSVHFKGKYYLEVA